MDYNIGIDIGTGSVKAVAVDLEGKSFAASQRHYPYAVPEVGYHEQDPVAIWTAFQQCLEELLITVAEQPMSVSLSSAMHSLIPVDRAGSPLHPMITWADSRASDIALKLQHKKEGLQIYEATGTPLHAMSPLVKLIWLWENEPDLFSRTHKFISIKEYIWYHLFGAFEIDHSIASCTGLFNLKSLDWDAAALSLVGVSTAELSSPVPTNYQRSYDGAVIPSLHAGIPVIIGASDGCLANLGSMAYRPGQAVMTIGTSGAVRTASSKPLPNSAAMPFSYILDEETFICGGPINNGGITLGWWLKNLGHQQFNAQAYKKLFDQIGQVAAGSEGLLFLPYLTGERAPIWDSESCGAFVGARLRHEQQHFSRAVVEGICYAMRDVLESVATPQDLREVFVTGGFSKSESWVQMLADVTGKELYLSQTEDASAIGATYLAMKTLGQRTSYPEAVISAMKKFVPDHENHLLYSKNFSIFKKLYVNMKACMHDLNQINL